MYLGLFIIQDNCVPDKQTIVYFSFVKYISFFKCICFLIAFFPFWEGCSGMNPNSKNTLFQLSILKLQKSTQINICINYGTQIIFYLLCICLCSFNHPNLHATKWLFGTKQFAVTWFQWILVIHKSEQDQSPIAMILSTQFFLLSLLDEGNASDGCPSDCHYSPYKKALLKTHLWKRDTVAWNKKEVSCKKFELF